MKTLNVGAVRAFFGCFRTIRHIATAGLLCCTIATAALAAELKTPGPAPSDALFDLSRVIQIEIRLDPNDWHALRISHPDLDANGIPITMKLLFRWTGQRLDSLIRSLRLLLGQILEETLICFCVAVLVSQTPVRFPELRPRERARRQRFFRSCLHNVSLSINPADAVE